MYPKYDVIYDRKYYHIYQKQSGRKTARLVLVSVTQMLKQINLLKVSGFISLQNTTANKSISLSNQNLKDSKYPKYQN